MYNNYNELYYLFYLLLNVILLYKWIDIIFLKKYPTVS